jgi:hypothetical protein
MDVEYDCPEGEWPDIGRSDFKHPNVGKGDWKVDAAGATWVVAGHSPKYHVTLFWAGKKDPDEFDTDDIGTYNVGPPIIGDGLVMCIKEN